MSLSACLFRERICEINEKAEKKTCPLTKSSESRWMVRICGAGLLNQVRRHVSLALAGRGHTAERCELRWYRV